MENAGSQCLSINMLMKLSSTLKLHVPDNVTKFCRALFDRKLIYLNIQLKLNHQCISLWPELEFRRCRRTTESLQNMCSLYSWNQNTCGHRLAFIQIPVDLLHFRTIRSMPQLRRQASECLLHVYITLWLLQMGRSIAHLVTLNKRFCAGTTLHLFKFYYIHFMMLDI